MELPTATMRTPGGTLKAPPYLHAGMKRSDCLKEPCLADILKDQFLPFKCRMHAHPEKKYASDRELERKLNKLMSLTWDMKEDCVKARWRGQRTHKIYFGRMGSVIEVFFDRDLDLQVDKTDTLVGQSQQEVNEAAATYEQIDIPQLPGVFYLALDNKYRRMFVYFSEGFATVYGEEIGRYVLESTTHNIEEYAEVHPPSLPKGNEIRQSSHEDWLLSNPHLCWAPWSRAGLYSWGLWVERGPQSRGLCATTDAARLPLRVVPILGDLLKSFGNISRAKRVLFGAVDRDARNLYQDMVYDLPSPYKQLWMTEQDECFTLRTCSINLLSNPHYTNGDRKDDWEVIAPMGEFRGGDICIREMGRRVVFQPGGIGFIRGGKLEHFTAVWEGVRYCLVSSVHKGLRNGFEKRREKHR